jgi:uncharacterized membrane protein
MDSILLQIASIVLMVAVLIFIARGDRRIRRQREQEDREKQHRQAADESGQPRPPT